MNHNPMNPTACRAWSEDLPAAGVDRILFSIAPVPFFRRAEQLMELHREVESWLGTPFHPHARIKGVGASCQSFAAELYTRCGFPVPALPLISLRHFRVHRESAIARFIDGELADRFAPAKLPPDRIPAAGDFLHFEFSDCEHCGVSLGDWQFAHAHIRRGVVISSLQDPTYGDALKRVWIPVL